MNIQEIKEKYCVDAPEFANGLMSKFNALGKKAQAQFKASFDKNNPFLSSKVDETTKIQMQKIYDQAKEEKAALDKYVIAMGDFVVESNRGKNRRRVVV